MGDLVPNGLPQVAVAPMVAAIPKKERLVMVDIVPIFLTQSAEPQNLVNCSRMANKLVFYKASDFECSVLI
jgi:hypothetical protein